ncbi:MAG: glutathione S-transferase family protein [Gammaproteobacteria bacterium]|nr:glutathione S-transferase family protein [Gammaproteobacteria bacterium]
MTIEFYTAPKSVGLASHVALLENKLDFDLRVLDTTKQQQTSSEYKKINPKARVPSMIIEGTVLTETPAILVYIAQMAPDGMLALPADPLEFAQIQSFNSYLCSTVHVAHAHRHRGKRWVDDEHALKALTANVPKTMALCMKMIEDHFFHGPWVLGDTFSICDCYLFAITEWFESDGVDISHYPKLERYRDTMLQRDSVQSAFSALEGSI